MSEFRFALALTKLRSALIPRGTVKVCIGFVKICIGPCKDLLALACIGSVKIYIGTVHSGCAKQFRMNQILRLEFGRFSAVTKLFQAVNCR